MMIDEEGFVYCDCCQTEKLAQVVGRNLVIKDRRHGSKHVAVISMADILDRMQTKPDNILKNQAAEVTTEV